MLGARGLRVMGCDGDGGGGGFDVLQGMLGEEWREGVVVKRGYDPVLLVKRGNELGGGLGLVVWWIRPGCGSGCCLGFGLG